MKAFIALLLATVAIVAEGSAVSTVWPSHYGGWNSWNGWNGWNGWNDHGALAYPYAKSWSSSWQGAPLYKGWDGYDNGARSWGLPWGSYGNGWGHHGVVKAVVPAKTNYWGAPWGSYGSGAYGWEH
ncbi:uncharacterized protein LOC129732796 [Wyeomyia smithii]|uniref:uncharacterized protein LOC129732796 n=1 Tax=Wyeomyia smithii TaxID=174621 RepID=UPI002467C8C2|nr:uncharacterized protein LOC129732796 [Wyeomyia smithii]